MNQLITAFNGGEISPLLTGRVDLPNLSRACRIMRGFIPGLSGGAFRRPPLLHVGMAGQGGARLIPFNYSAGTSFQIEAGENYLRFWNADGTGGTVQQAAPWSVAQLGGLQFVQSNDVMWFASAAAPPQELQRTGTGDGWVLKEIPWKYPPLRDDNLGEITIKVEPSEPGGPVDSGTVKLTASKPLFEQGHKGAFWEISHFRETQSAEIAVPVIPPASAVMTFTVVPAEGQKFTIGGTDYIWTAAGSLKNPNQVAIGAGVGEAAIKASRDNALAAINATGTGGTEYGLGTAPNPDVEAADGGKLTAGTAATGRLTSDGVNKLHGVMIRVGTIYYRIDQDTMFYDDTNHIYDVRKGATTAETLGNLVKAINLTGVGGTDYTTGLTVANAEARASMDGTTAIVLTAKATGTLGNSVVTTSTSGRLSFGKGTLAGGVDTPTFKLKVSARTPGAEGNKIVVSDNMTTDGWLGYTSIPMPLTGGTDVSDTSEEVRIKGQWDFTTYGRWAGTVYIEQKNAAGTWDILRKVNGRMDTNRSLSGVVEGEGILQLRVERMSGQEATGVPSPRFLLEAVDSMVHGLVRIDDVDPGSDKKVAYAKVVSAIHSSEATPNWREGAFSTYRGFPAAVAMHEQRLIFAGSPSEPQKLWASVTGDFRNFEETGFDDGSWQYQLATQEGNAIRWVVSQTGLIIGTAGDEWLMDGGDRGITPTSAQAKRQSAYGSDPVVPVMAGSVVPFVQRGGLSLLEYVYDFQQAGYIAPNITQLVDHLTRTGIRSVAMQRAPWPVLWVVTGDQQLIACTYARAAEVIGWAPQPVDGKVTSVSVVYGKQGEADEVWIVVDRGASSSSYRLERFEPTHWKRLHAGEPVWHMDAAVESPVSGGVAGGFSHLNGKTVAVLVNGQEQPQQKVAGGKINVTVDGATSVIAGLVPPDSVLQPMIFDIPTDSGSSQGRKYHVPEMAVRFYQTRECAYADAPGRPEFQVSFRDSEAQVNVPPPLFTGQKSVSCSAGYNNSADVVLMATGIHPLNVLSLIPRVQVYGS